MGAAKRWGLISCERCTFVLQKFVSGSAQVSLAGICQSVHSGGWQVTPQAALKAIAAVEKT